MSFQFDPIGHSGGMNSMFSIIPFIVVIGFIVVFIMIIANAVKHFQNASAPKQSYYARVVAKRMEVSTSHHSHNHNHDHMGHMHTTSRTHYYLTLEFDNGHRKEYLDVKNLYGLVVEGDTGYAQIQGDWIVAFERSYDENSAPYM